MSAAAAAADRVRPAATRSRGRVAARTRRAAGALLTVVLSAGAVLVGQPVTPAVAAAGDVTVTVEGVTPLVPPTSAKPTPVTFTLTLTNNTGHDLSHVQLRAVRGVPFQAPSTLEDDITTPTPPTGGLDIPIHPASVDLPAGATATSVTVSTTISTTDGKAGICQCANGVYPIWFFAHAVDSSGVDERLGQAHTYLPSFDGVAPDGTAAVPAKRQVSWVLPLVDRPHRLLGTTDFVDDDLAQSVASGRLERLLQVIEQVGQDGTPVTVVIDPELLDELQIMATRPYTVEKSTEPGSTATVKGQGHDAASAWLTRLRAVLAQDPSVSVTLTSYADPDVQAATQDRLPWSGRLPAVMQTRVERALGLDSLPATSLSWPASGALGRAALRSVAREGATAALLPASAVQRSHGSNGLPISLVRLSAYGQ
ncbi:MAG: hypothetical protein INR72_16500, partial [Williamsia herbipolensis]|nr:hypothetical protein [Williamsia herbipolensis]